MKEDLESVNELAGRLQQANPELRRGQALMFALGDHSMEVYNKIHGSELDCYYNDGRAYSLEKFIAESVF